MKKPIIVVSTFPNKRILDSIANKLVSENIVACVNISKISSVYSWRGKIENTNEYLAIFKTTSKKKDTLKKRLKELHPYDVPEIAQIDVVSINSPYMKWLVDATTAINPR